MSKWWFVQVDKWALHRVKPHRWMPHATVQFRVGLNDFVYHLTSEWWVGIYLTAISFRGCDFRAREGLVIPVTRPSVKKRDVGASASGDSDHLAKMETSMFSDLLPIVEHCAFVRYEDKTPRAPGWITIKTLGAAWVVQVKDPDGACSFQFVADSIDKALEGAALLLACDDAPWQPDPFLKKKK